MSAHQWAARATTPTAAPIRYGSASVIVQWVVQLALAALCLMVGVTTLTGTPPVANMFAAVGRAVASVNVFNAVGLGLWFYYVAGVAEVTAAIVLLLPSAARYVAVLLIPTMIGAVANNVFILQASPIAPLAILIATTGVAFARVTTRQDRSD